MKGHMLSLLVISRSDETVYQDFLQSLESVFKGDIAEANPVRTEHMNVKSVFTILRSHKSHKYFNRELLIKLYFSIKIRLTRWLPFKFLGTNKDGRLAQYIPTMRTHADYRKFDDVLRMVLDCTEEQIQNIEQYLESKYNEGQLFYGLYRSNTALMTCYVQTLDPGQHIHFIDGGDGGYAMAAKQLKAQLKND